eukprot:jgi/Mesvir1/403/Mv11294-RA.1
MAGYLAEHRHGKSKVRVGRVWREDAVHHIVEWNCFIMLDSKADKSFLSDDCSSVIATDTMKNTVYYVAQKLDKRCALEVFALALVDHFLTKYDHVTGVDVAVAEKRWERATVGGQPHDHGFMLGGADKNVVRITRKRGSTPVIESGVDGLELLKTTQSGFEKFYRDSLTTLPDVRDRIVASSVTARWGTQPGAVKCYGGLRRAVRAALTEEFFGPPKGGIYSASVQRTLYLMAEQALKQCPELDWVSLTMPNLHFIPMNAPSIGIKFNNDVYVPTDEPHGNIHAKVARVGAKL